MNIGDLTARWCNDRWISTPHRVVNPPRGAAEGDRLSLAYFHAPNADALIECLPTCADARRPPKHPPVKAGEYIRAKLAKARRR